MKNDLYGNIQCPECGMSMNPIKRGSHICVANTESIKPSNPKDPVGVRKAPMSTLPAPVLFEMGLAMMEGARKYGRHNYRAVGVRASVYYDAFMRHVAAWWEGEDTDPDSGLPHLSKAGACLVVLRDSLRRGNCNDDRPPKVDAGWVQGLNRLAADIVDRYPDAKTPFTEKATEVRGWFETMEDTEDTDECDLLGCVCHIQVETGTTAGPCEYEPRDQDW